MTPVSGTAACLELIYGERRIHCEVRRSSLRTRPSVAIHVEPDGRVLVDAPLQASLPDIRMAVSRRLTWIHRRLLETEQNRKHLTPREYVSGETMFYLGRRYTLKVLVNQEIQTTRLRGAYLEISVSDRSTEIVRGEVEKWYRSRARTVLPARLSTMSARLKWVKTIPPLSIRAMHRQWGSCSPNGRIALNVGLMKVRTDCIDYVILHELVHLKEHNHGPAFYRTLDRHLPDWRRIKFRLDAMAELALT